MSALPVIVRILMDMGLYRTDPGMLVISAAIRNDITGWIIFAIVLSLLWNPAGNAQPIILTITLILAFTGLMLTLGRYWGLLFPAKSWVAVWGTGGAGCLHKNPGPWALP